MFTTLLRTGRRQAIALVALFFALGGTSLAVAAGGPKPTTYYACVTKSFKTLNLTSKAGRCGPGERKITFNSEGARGLRGLQGKTGARGAAGAAGAKGDTGAAGAVGQTGAVGPKGEAGAKGETGAVGATGVDGVRGATGAAGAKGETGATGATGVDGVRGATGAAGAKGDTGATGAAGATGDTGLDGVRGATGAEGPRGATGPKGDTGTPGTQGAKGDKGDTGPQGAPGQAAAGGGGAVLKDANGVTLGTVLSALTNNRILTAYYVQTPKGFQVEVPVTGVLRPAQIYFTDAACKGTPYLNDGSGASGAAGATASGKFIVYSGQAGTLLQMATVDADGAARAVRFTSSTIENSDCSTNAGARGGWLLKPISRNDAGLPPTIKAPLTVGN